MVIVLKLGSQLDNQADFFTLQHTENTSGGRG